MHLLISHLFIGSVLENNNNNNYNVPSCPLYAPTQFFYERKERQIFPKMVGSQVIKGGDYHHDICYSSGRSSTLLELEEEESTSPAPSPIMMATDCDVHQRLFAAVSNKEDLCDGVVVGDNPVKEESVVVANNSSPSLCKYKSRKRTMSSSSKTSLSDGEDDDVVSNPGPDSDWEDIEEDSDDDSTTEDEEDAVDGCCRPGAMADDDDEDDDCIMFRDDAEPFSFTCLQSTTTCTTLSPKQPSSLTKLKGLKIRAFGIGFLCNGVGGVGGGHCWMTTKLAEGCNKLSNNKKPTSVPETLLEEENIDHDAVFSERMRKVQFKDEADLVQIIEFEDDPQAREDRSYWKFFFINQARFKDRICQTEEALGNIFSLAHRDKVYTERILPFQQNHEIGGEIQNRSGGELIKLSRHSCIEDSTTK